MTIVYLISYKPLFKLLLDRNMKEKVLAQKANISPATISKMKKYDANINISILAKICIVLECTLNDIVEIKGIKTNDHQ